MRHACFDRFVLRMPQECVDELSQPGKVDDAVDYWADKLAYLNMDIDTEDVRAELKECGAWDDEELADEGMNWQRIIWVAACNIAEEDKS